MDGHRTTHEPIDTELLGLLTGWLPGRRWFPVKGARAELAVVGGLTLVDPLDEARVRVLLVRAVAPGIDILVQVPVTLRPAARATSSADAPPAASGVPPIGTMADGSVVLDACGDPAFLRAWLAAAQGPGSGADASRARVLSGEQSNTSVILPAGVDGDVAADGPGGFDAGAGTVAGAAGDDPSSQGGPDPRAAILKVFRVPSPGANPDVDVPRALTAAGWTHVPRPLAWFEAQWPADGGHVTGHLAVLSAFVTDAEDGFELACARARDGESFAGLAHELGGIIAGMHAALRAALPVDEARPDEVRHVEPSDDGPAPPDGSGPDGVEPRYDGSADSARARAVADAVRDRFGWARPLVPALDGYAAQVELFAERLEGLSGVPVAQRIHGDLHLGQVLRARGTWTVTDFEGEPLAPIPARTRPDLALRDVAGMLRSVDYAAAVGGASDAGWAEAARAGLLEGYLAAPTASSEGSEGSEGDRDVRTELLRALELDKALYEAVYEARNRPDWLPIPLAAVTRLLGGPSSTGPGR